jgi:hypothetical protein
VSNRTEASRYAMRRGLLRTGLLDPHPTID